MPTLHLHIAPPAGADRTQLAADLALGLTDLTRQHLSKAPDLTAVLVHFVEPQHWFIGGRSLAQTGQPGAQVEIAVTGDTNTASQKAAWTEDVYGLLRQHLPGLSETSYAIVRDVPASAWGYGGLTQEARRQVA